MKKKYDLNIHNTEKIIGMKISYTDLTFNGVSVIRTKGCYTFLFADGKGEVGYVNIHRTLSYGWSTRYNISVNNEIYDKISKPDMIGVGDLCNAIGFIFLDYFTDKYK